jgi:hypothetical protein
MCCTLKKNYPRVHVVHWLCGEVLMGFDSRVVYYTHLGAWQLCCSLGREMSCERCVYD